jgi:hypothetical protein
METVKTYPRPEDVVADLKQIVQKLDRWERVPLPALRSLLSVRYGEPSAHLLQSHADDPNHLICDTITKRITQAIGRTGSEGNREALACLFNFQRPDVSVTARRHEARNHGTGVKAESFRTYSEKGLLLKLAEELFRSELEWADNHLDPALKQ